MLIPSLRTGRDKTGKLTQADCYHRAANDLRSVDALDKSAQCYFSAAAAAFNEARRAMRGDKAADKPIALALRSAGRAKAQYAAIGMDDAADDSHRLQQEVLRWRYHLDRNPIRFLLWIWRVVTGYGTSARSWFTWLIFSLALFTFLYWVLYATGCLQLANGAKFTPPITAAYLAIINLVAFGAYTQIVPLHWLAELVLGVQAVMSFVLVGTGVTFLARR